MKLQQWVGIDVSTKALEVFVRASQRVLNVGDSQPDLATLVTELLAVCGVDRCASHEWSSAC